MNNILPRPATIQYLNQYSGVYFLGAPEALEIDPWHICPYIHKGSFDLSIRGLPTFSARLFTDLDEE